MRMNGKRISSPEIGERSRSHSAHVHPGRPIHYNFALALGLGKHPPVGVDYFIHEGDRIGPLQVLFAPGHSPGHLAFYWADRKLLVVGDAVATWPKFELGWRGFTLNPKQHRKSLYRLAELDPEILCVGHGDPLPAGAGTRIKAALQD